MTRIDMAAAPGRRIRQRRGQQTYEALIATGFALLESSEFDAITIAELSRKAGYSVGAFYARFRSKDEFFDALLVKHFEQRRRLRDRVMANATRDTLIHDLIKDIVSYYWKRRHFWRAALIRGMRDAAFWKPLVDHANETADALLAEIAGLAQRDLTDAERMNVRFALHVALGAINNSIVNRPGPVLFLGRVRFVESLTRAFGLVSGYDELVGVTTRCDEAHSRRSS